MAFFSFISFFLSIRYLQCDKNHPYVIKTVGSAYVCNSKRIKKNIKQIDLNLHFYSAVSNHTRNLQTSEPSHLVSGQKPTLLRI